MQAPSIGEELRRSWRAMVAVIIGMWVSSLPAYSFGAFIQPLNQEFGWTITQITGWSAAWSLGCIISAPAVGTLADRVGARIVILGGLSLLAAALLAACLLTDRLIVFYMSGFAIGAIGAATSAITYGRLVSRMFDRGLGTALGLMSTGIGLGALTGPRAMQMIIDLYGWRSAFATQAVLAISILPILLFWLRERHHAGRTWQFSPQHGVGLTRAAAMRMPVFWVLCLGAVLYGVCVGGVSVNLIPYLTYEGMSRADAATAAGLFGASTVVGRLSGGIIIDRVGIHAAHLMAIVLAAEAVSFIVLGTYGGIILLLALPIFGLAVGAEADCLAYCTVKIFGRAHYGSIFGVIGIVMLYIGTGVGPILFSLTREYVGSYTLAFYVWSLLAFTAAPIFLWVAKQPFHDSPQPEL